MIGKDRNSELPLKIDQNKKVVIKFPGDVSQNLGYNRKFYIFLSIIAASSILIRNWSKKLIIFI